MRRETPTWPAWMLDEFACVICGGVIETTSRVQFGPVTTSELECQGCGWQGVMSVELLGDGTVDVEAQTTDA